MKRPAAIVGAIIAALVLLSMFAPAPFTRTVQANESAACQGLTNAYNHCRANNPTGNCDAIFDQLLAHSCHVGSSSGSR